MLSLFRLLFGQKTSQLIWTMSKMWRPKQKNWFTIRPVLRFLESGNSRWTWQIWQRVWCWARQKKSHQNRWLARRTVGFKKSNTLTLLKSDNTLQTQYQAVILRTCSSRQAQFSTLSIPRSSRNCKHVSKIVLSWLKVWTSNVKLQNCFRVRGKKRRNGDLSWKIPKRE